MLTMELTKAVDPEWIPKGYVRPTKREEEVRVWRRERSKVNLPGIGSHCRVLGLGQ
jgi:hypothetical protein